MLAFLGRQSTLSCQICDKEIFGELGVPDKCQHTFHIDCLKDLADIARSESSDAYCPIPGCGTTFQQIYVKKTSGGKILRSVIVGSHVDCPICCEPVKNPIAMPESCNHIFCLSCILEWSKVRHECPLDRGFYELILVSDFIGGPIKKRIKAPPVSQPTPVEEEAQPPVSAAIDYTVCEVCGTGDREEILLLCDICDRAYHTVCLPQPVRRVPRGDWHCPNCAVTRTTESSRPVRQEATFALRRIQEQEAAHLESQRSRGGRTSAPRKGAAGRATASRRRRERVLFFSNGLDSEESEEDEDYEPEIAEESSGSENEHAQPQRESAIREPVRSHTNRPIQDLSNSESSQSSIDTEEEELAETEVSLEESSSGDDLPRSSVHTRKRPSVEMDTSFIIDEEEQETYSIVESNSDNENYSPENIIQRSTRGENRARPPLSPLSNVSESSPIRATSSSSAKRRRLLLSSEESEDTDEQSEDRGDRSQSSKSSKKTDSDSLAASIGDITMDIIQEYRSLDRPGTSTGAHGPRKTVKRKLTKKKRRIKKKSTTKKKKKSKQSTTRKKVKTKGRKKKSTKRRKTSAKKASAKKRSSGPVIPRKKYRSAFVGLPSLSLNGGEKGYGLLSESDDEPARLASVVVLPNEPSTSANIQYQYTLARDTSILSRILQDQKLVLMSSSNVILENDGTVVPKNGADTTSTKESDSMTIPKESNDTPVLNNTETPAIITPSSAPIPIESIIVKPLLKAAVVADEYSPSHPTEQDSDTGKSSQPLSGPSLKQLSPGKAKSDESSSKEIDKKKVSRTSRRSRSKSGGRRRSRHRSTSRSKNHKPSYTRRSRSRSRDKHRRRSRSRQRSRDNPRRGRRSKSNSRSRRTENGSGDMTRDSRRDRGDRNRIHRPSHDDRTPTKDDIVQANLRDKREDKPMESVKQTISVVNTNDKEDNIHHREEETIDRRDWQYKRDRGPRNNFHRETNFDTIRQPSASLLSGVAALNGLPMPRLPGIDNRHQPPNINIPPPFNPVDGVNNFIGGPPRPFLPHPTLMFPRGFRPPWQGFNRDGGNRMPPSIGLQGPPPGFPPMAMPPARMPGLPPPPPPFLGQETIPHQSMQFSGQENVEELHRPLFQNHESSNFARQQQSDNSQNLINISLSSSQSAPVMGVPTASTFHDQIRVSMSQAPSNSSSDLLATLMSKAGLPQDSLRFPSTQESNSTVTRQAVPPRSSASPLNQINKLLNSAASNILNQLGQLSSDDQQPKQPAPPPPPPMPPIGRQLDSHAPPPPPIGLFVPPPMPSYDLSPAKQLSTQPPPTIPSFHTDSRPDKASVENESFEKCRKDQFSKKEWYERIASDVKNILKPHFISKRISKNDYKEILKKSVTKIGSRAEDINLDKIKKLVSCYVEKYAKHKNKKGRAEVTSSDHEFY